MIIDFHTHLYSGLKTQMEQSGVDKAVILLKPKRSIYTPKGRIIYLRNDEILTGNEEVIETWNRY